MRRMRMMNWCDCGFFEGQIGDCICNKRYSKDEDDEDESL